MIHFDEWKIFWLQRNMIQYNNRRCEDNQIQDIVRIFRKHKKMRWPKMGLVYNKMDWVKVFLLELNEIIISIDGLDTWLQTQLSMPDRLHNRHSSPRRFCVPHPPWPNQFCVLINDHHFSLNHGSKADPGNLFSAKASLCSFFVFLPTF